MLRTICLLFIFCFSNFSTILLAEETAKPAQTTTQTAAAPSPYFSDEEPEHNKNSAQETHFGELLVRMLLILTITVVALVLISWFTKRFLYSRMQDLNRSSRIQILEKRTLSPKSLLYIVKIDGEEVALAESPNGVVVVKVLPK